MGLSLTSFKLTAPFSATDLILSKTFAASTTTAFDRVESVVSAPFLACITLWIIIQGILVMRGNVDTRAGITKLLMVSLVAGLVTNQPLYVSYVQDFFEQTVPQVVSKIIIDPISSDTSGEAVPGQLDAVFLIGENLFQLVAARIGPDDMQSTIAFEGAHLAFIGSLWTVFGIYDIVNIMTSTLVAIGPLILIGYLFESTRNMTIRWVSQLTYYGLLLLLLSIVATVVVGVDFLMSTAASAAILVLGPTAAKLVGLDELDMFYMTGDALVLALPTIAAVISSGAADSAAAYSSQLVQRRLGISQMVRALTGNRAPETIPAPRARVRDR
jgi:type IV secretion system protein VirB6